MPRLLWRKSTDSRSRPWFTEGFLHVQKPFVVSQHLLPRALLCGSQRRAASRACAAASPPIDRDRSWRPPRPKRSCLCRGRQKYLHTLSTGAPVPELWQASLPKPPKQPRLPATAFWVRRFWRSWRLWPDTGDRESAAFASRCIERSRRMRRDWRRPSAVFGSGGQLTI